MKITGKAGASLQRELPTDIRQLYHDMREAGISKPLKSIQIHGDKDVEVRLSSDSEIGTAFYGSSARTTPWPTPTPWPLW